MKYDIVGRLLLVIPPQCQRWSNNLPSTPKKSSKDGKLIVIELKHYVEKRVDELFTCSSAVEICVTPPEAIPGPFWESVTWYCWPLAL